MFRSFVTVGATTSGIFFFFSIFRHRVVYADAMGMPFDLQQEHTFPTLEGHPYPSLGSYEDTPNTSRVIRFVLPKPTDRIIMNGVCTACVKTLNSDANQHVFPIPSENTMGYFDLLVWNDKKADSLYHNHITGDSLIIQKGQKLFEYQKNRYTSIVLLIDPTGVAPALQLIHDIRNTLDHKTDSVPNINVLYFKPETWSLTTPTDHKLIRNLKDLSKKAGNNNIQFNYILEAPTKTILQTFRKITTNTLILAICSSTLMPQIEQHMQQHQKQNLVNIYPENRYITITTHELILS